MGKLKLVSTFLLIPLWQGMAQTWDMAPQTPEVATLAKYGAYPISYYTGTPQIAIPLYTIKEQGLEIPLTLSYSGTGARVADESTWVGLGWNLYPGGHISRLVQGSQFDNHNSEVYQALLNDWDQFEDKSYYSRHSEYPTWYIPGRSDIEDIGNGSSGLYPPNTAPHIELPGFPVPSFRSWSQQAQYFQPDIYSFNFLGYAGKFFINPETGNPAMLDKKDPILFKRDNEPWNPEIDGWKATLPNGIVIYFEDIEKVQPETSCTISPPSLTWKITRIVFTNNEEISFSYNSTTYETASITNVDIHSFEDDNDYELNRYNDYDLFNVPSPTINCSSNREPVYIINERRILTQISLPGHIVKFNQVPGEAKPRLNSMEIYDKSAPQIKIGYQFFFEEFNIVGQGWHYWGNNPANQIPLERVDASTFIKYKLTKLQKYGIKNGSTTYEPPHEFFYTENIGLPPSLSYAQDYWGYYNGQHQNTGLIPDESQMFNNEGYFPVVHLPKRRPIDDLRKKANSNRGPSAAHMVQGTLNKIIYPTKGYTVFNFEPHEFYLSGQPDYLLQADEIIYNSASGHYQNNYNGSPNALSRGGGVRIKEIINHDANGRFLSRKKFDYQNSGLLLEPVSFWRIERYLKAYDVSDAIHYYKTWHASGSNYNQSFAIPNTIGYSLVRVIESDRETEQVGEQANGRTEYSFHNYETHYNPEAFSVSLYYLNARNGLPRAIRYLDNANRIIKSTEYTYKKVEENMFLAMAAKHIHDYSSDLFNVFKVEYSPLKTEWWKEDYVTETTDGVSQRTTFDYSLDGQANLISKKTETSEGDIVEARYRYPLDYNLSETVDPTSDPTYRALQKMVQDNIVNTATETVNIKNGQLISGTLSTYKLFHGIPQMYQSFAIESAVPVGLNPMSEQNHTTLFDWTYATPTNGENVSGSFVKDNLYSTAKITFSKYDERGNLLEYSTSDGQYGSYLWGYNYTLPVAKVIGATYANFEDDVNVIGLQNMDGETLQTELDKLRSKPNTLVTTYSYNPLWGIISVTDPAKQTTYFNYDGLGRLSVVKDQAKDIVEHYEYHYAGQ